MHCISYNGSLFFLKEIENINGKILYDVPVAGGLQGCGYFKSIFIYSSFAGEVKYFLELGGITNPGAAVFKFYFYNVILIVYFNFFSGAKATGVAYCYWLYQFKTLEGELSLAISFSLPLMINLRSMGLLFRGY